jgi:hypothetical protein
MGYIRGSSETEGYDNVHGSLLAQQGTRPRNLGQPPVCVSDVESATSKQ